MPTKSGNGGHCPPYYEFHKSDRTAIDKLVNGLINGDKELGLPPATDQVFFSKMREIGNKSAEKINDHQQAIAVQQAVDAMNSLTLAAQETVNSITQIKVGTQQLKEAAQNLKAMV